jgi:hypothetical protein
MLQPCNLTHDVSQSSTRHLRASRSPTRGQRCPIIAQSLNMAQASLAGKPAPVHHINVLAQAAASKNSRATLSCRPCWQGALV